MTPGTELGFKSGLSTSMCTGVLKAIVSHYNLGGSKVYGCLIDATKAFDTVDHTILFEKLLARGLPNVVIRFILNWYLSQRLCVNWNGHLSEQFPVSQGVRQGGILSPILFALYIDDLLLELSQSKVGCHWYGTFAGALAYADDITLLAPSPSALRKLLQICENFGASHKMRFNPDKTQCICFCKGNANLSQDSRFLFCGKSIALSTSVTHLGHILTSKLQDDHDIQRCLLDFVKRANSTLYRFKFCTPRVLVHLLRSYCMSFYGCAIWSLNTRSIRSIDVSMNKILRRIWSLPFNCHTDLLHVISNCTSVFNVCYSRCCKLISQARACGNYLVRSVFSTVSCRNFIGYNLKFGHSFVRSYNSVSMSLANLIMEIKDPSLFVNGFVQHELNQLANFISTM